MSNDAQPTASVYAAVIEDLRAKRDKIDQIIADLVELEAKSTNVPTKSATPLPKVKPPKEVAGMLPGDACVWLLREKGVPMTNREISDGLSAIGYKKIKATDNVNSALRHRQANKHDVVRDGKTWRYVEILRSTSESAVAAVEQYVNGNARHVVVGSGSA